MTPAPANCSFRVVFRSMASPLAVAFSFMSPATGILGLFENSYRHARGPVIACWILVAVGQFLVGLVFAEFASTFPQAGSVYGWTRQSAHAGYSRCVAWFYVCGGVLTLTAAAGFVPNIVWRALDAPGHTGDCPHATIASAVVILVAGALAAARTSAAALVNNIGVVCELAAMVALGAVLIGSAHRHPAAPAVSPSDASSLEDVTGALPMALFVFYGFDAASSLGEETQRAERNAPLAILISIAGAAIVGLVFLLGLTAAAPSADSSDPIRIVRASAPLLSRAFDVVAIGCVLACCVSTCMGTSRFIVALARNDELPASSWLRRVSTRANAPPFATGAVVLAALLPVPIVTHVAPAATALVYIAYLSALLSFLRYDFVRQPEVNIGLARTPIRIVAVMFTAAVLLVLFHRHPDANPRTGSLPVIGDRLAALPVVWVTTALVVACAIGGEILRMVWGRGRSVGTVLSK